MKGLNLSSVKKVMLTVLVALVNIVYHTDVTAYVKYTNTTTQASCTSYCSGYVGLWATDIYSATGAVNSSWVPGGWSTSRCVCVTTAEYNSMTTCRATYCSARVSGGVKGNLQYNLSGGSCTYSSCSCNTGYWKYSATTCSICPKGSYCLGGYTVGYGKTACPAGRYTATTGLSTCTACSSGYYAAGTGNTGCTACPAGRYAATSGLGTCTPCEAGYYAAGTASSKCTLCDANKYANSYTTGATACNWCPGYYPAYGTTPSSAAGYSPSGTAGPAGCYVKSSQEFTNSTGTYHFPSDCYYVS